MHRAILFVGVVTVNLTFSILFVPRQAEAADKHWNFGADGQWSEAAKWTLPGMPGAADNAYIGTLGGVANTTVFMDQPVTLNNLVLTDGMALRTAPECCEGVVGHKLTVNNVTAIDSDARLIVRDAGPGVDFETDTLDLEYGDLWLSSAIASINDRLDIGVGGEIHGTGQVRLNGSGATLVNDGSLLHGAGVTTYMQLGGGDFNLDGLAGNGDITVTSIGGESPDAYLIFTGGGMTDSFSGSLLLGPNSTLDMSVGPWVADANSTINAYLGAVGPQRLTGDQATIAGDVIISEYADFHVDADVVFAPTVNVDIYHNAYVHLGPGKSTTVQGGHFSIGQESTLDFNGATTLHGGTFHTFSNLSADGVVRFQGATTWDGDVAIDGIAMQVGPATVSGPTVVTAGVLDMDGGGGTVWNVGNALTINTTSVDSSINNTFDGVLNVSGGFLGKLAVNLTGAFDEWTMAGELNLAGMGMAAFPLDRLDGSRMRVTGEVNVEHRVRVAADVTFENSSEVTLDGAASRLQLTGRTIVGGSTTFHGDGVLENGTTGELLLADDASLGGVGLSNRGLLEIGSLAGTAAVDRFENHASGTWLVELGGTLPDSFDRLLMGGEATLDGLLGVELIDAGGGLFLPEIGDTFTVLTALGGVNGTFDADPVSNAGGQQFHWNVIYTPNDVILELASVTVPEPSAVVVAGVGVLAMMGRRRPRG